jgi:hypothetical protein
MTRRLWPGTKHIKLRSVECAFCLLRLIVIVGAFSLAGAIGSVCAQLFVGRP